MFELPAPDPLDAVDAEHAARNLALARRYLAALEARAPVDEILAFYAAGAEQFELPNALVPAGARRGLAEIRDGALRGRQVISAERYDVRGAVAAGDRVMLEILWTGTVAVPLGRLAPGDAMHAHFALVTDFRDGRIVSQRNYDCFESFR